MATPTQEDREAAASLIEWHNGQAAQWEVAPDRTLQFWRDQMPAEIRAGKWDDSEVVQRFAAHRPARASVSGDQ